MSKIILWPVKLIFAPFMALLCVVMVLVESALDKENRRTPKVNRREWKAKMHEYFFEGQR